MFHKSHSYLQTLSYWMITIQHVEKNLNFNHCRYEGTINFCKHDLIIDFNTSLKELRRTEFLIWLFKFFSIEKPFFVWPICMYTLKTVSTISITHPNMTSSPYLIGCLGLSEFVSSCSSRIGKSVPSDLK